jgi:hypothetical protein
MLHGPAKNNSRPRYSQLNHFWKSFPKRSRLPSAIDFLNCKFMVPRAAVNREINLRCSGRLIHVDLQVAIQSASRAGTGKLQNLGCLRLILAHHGSIFLDFGS